jgi:exonuclease III
MDQQNNHNLHDWKLLCWNITGINSSPKWTAITSKIFERNCDIICLQKTKKEIFDIHYLRKFCPSSFDCFEYIPSQGASGGTIIIWKSSKFSGHAIF